MEDRLPRKLAAILYADVAGYSRLTGEDEDATHRALSQHLDLIAASVESHGGKVMHFAGDAVLAQFNATVDAVSSAVAVQRSLRTRNAELPAGRRVQFRIGVNSGDVIEDRGDLYGDGVNIAARLEALAEPGGICISESVRAALGKKLGLHYEDMGEQRVKNIAEPVRAFRVLLGRETASVQPEDETSSLSPTSFSDSRPSLVVLPFTVIGGGPETNALADGMTDVVINTLSRTGQADIADRASAFAYKGQSPRPVEVAKALGVQYVLQGSVQQSGSRARVTAELFDAEANSHVWSERFDRKVEDVFEFQDDIAKRITQSVRSVIVYGVDWEVPTDSFDAWILNIQGVENYNKGSAEDNHRARKLFEEVTQLDPQYTYGPVNLSWTHIFDCLYAWSVSPEKSAIHAMDLAQQAYEVDQRDTFPFKEATLGVAMYLSGNCDQALELADESLARNPDEPCTMAWCTGWIHCLSGNLNYALAILEKSNKRFLHPPWNVPEYLGVCYLACNRPQDAIGQFERARSLAADGAFARALKAAAYMELGRSDRAESEMRQALNQRPGFSLRDFHYYLAFRDSAERERFSQALVQAGLPE